VLLPLYTRQIKSMQHMQALQPELQKIKTKYKDKTKQQEEQMRLYREAGVSPFSSCLPLLLQFPFLIAMFSVLRAPLYEPVNEGGQVVAYNVVNNHLPVDSQLFENTLTHTDRNFLAMNLDCTPRQVWSGPPTDIVDTSGNPAQAGLPLRSDDQDVTEPGGQVITSQSTLDCGASRSAVIPYAILLVIMTGASVFTTWQSQRMNPPGSQTGSQQAIMRIMPVAFLFFGINFTAALILYWTTSNLVQAGQQSVLIKLGHLGPDAVDRRRAEQRERQQQAATNPPKQSLMQRWMGRLEDTATQREQSKKPSKGTPGGSSSAKGKRSTPPPKPTKSSKPTNSTKRTGSAKPGNQLPRKPDPGGSGGKT
jgi:YidC/Oxa1 family membrane protein insertase